MIYANKIELTNDTGAYNFKALYRIRIMNLIQISKSHIHIKVYKETKRERQNVNSRPNKKNEVT